MFSSFKALCELFSKLFEWRAVETQHQSETELVKDKRDYKRATDIAEKIIKIAECYKPDMTFVHRLQFARLVEKFKKYN